MIDRFYIARAAADSVLGWEMHDRMAGTPSLIARIADPDLAYRIAELLNADLDVQ